MNIWNGIKRRLIKIICDKGTGWKRERYNYNKPPLGPKPPPPKLPNWKV